MFRYSVTKIQPTRLLFRCSLNRIAQFSTESPSPSSSSTSPLKVTLTDSCIKRLNEITASDSSKFLRVSVEGGGCSGFQYNICLDSKLTDEDCLFTREGAKVVIDKVSLEFLEGATIDFQSELIRSAFRVLKNPKAESGCSCGSSFSLKI